MAALVESLAAIAVGRRRKGRNLRRGGAGGGCHYHRRGDEFIGRLSRCLSQHEEGCGGQRSSGERKRRERDVGWKNWEGWFLANFGLDFLHTQAMKSTVIFRGWRREVFSLITPNLGFCFGWE
jgi:hypothetical protein